MLVLSLVELGVNGLHAASVVVEALVQDHAVGNVQVVTPSLKAAMQLLVLLAKVLLQVLLQQVHPVRGQELPPVVFGNSGVLVHLLVVWPHVCDHVVENVNPLWRVKVVAKLPVLHQVHQAHPAQVPQRRPPPPQPAQAQCNPPLWWPPHNQHSHWPVMWWKFAYALLQTLTAWQETLIAFARAFEKGWQLLVEFPKIEFWPGNSVFF